MFGNKKEKKIFGHIENVSEKYDITRKGEVHTKIVDVPSPINGRIRIDDELEPSRYLLMEFKEIHDSFYIGVNRIRFYDKYGLEVPFTNTKVDGAPVDHKEVKPAMPTNGWWAVAGTHHSLVFDFGQETHVAFVHVECTNSASTPKYIHFTDAQEPLDYEEEGAGFAENLYFQLAGENKSPDKIKFRSSPDSKNNLLNSALIVKKLNANPPSNGYETFMSEDAKDLFVFFTQGKRTIVCNYFFGREPSEPLDLVNSVVKDSGTEIQEPSLRAMSLNELRAVRAIILSNCVKNKWKSSRDGKTPLRPEDVNLYDLNSILIKPLTKKRKCSFKELFGSGETRPAYYVSHWWGESVLDFIRCCEYHATMHNLEASEASYWVCAYANRQHDLGTDLGTDPAQSSFNKAMKISHGTLLIIDSTVTATSRIWVAYELFRTTTSQNPLDICIYNNGGVRLIADSDLPDETPYQRTKREIKFPFEELSTHFLDIRLHRGEASQTIDKVRILNTMCRMTENLDNYEILERISKNDEEIMKVLAECDWSLRSSLAQKSISIALSIEGQDINDFYGFSLIDIIKRDKTCASMKFDDLVSLKAMTDEHFKSLIGLISPQIDSFVLNVQGCPNLTNECIYQLYFPDTLKNLDLGIGHARNITNDALTSLANSIPPGLETLSLNVTGFKNPDGTYLPPRYNDHLQALAENMPKNLQSFDLTTTLACDVESLEGLIALARGMPKTIKKFSLFLRWQGFTSDCLTIMAEELPASIEELSFTVHGGEYIDNENLSALRDACELFYNLQEFKLSSRDSGKVGYYLCRNFDSFHDLKDACDC